jgi:hypothetical protein
MWGRRCSTSLLSRTVLLATCASVITPGVGRAQTVSTPAPHRTAVSPFFLVPRAHAATLTGLSVVSVRSDERVTSACFDCGTTTFVARRASKTRWTLTPSPAPLHMHSATKIIVGVTGKKVEGRWIVIHFKQRQYSGLDHDCMPASISVLTPAMAADPSPIRASCPPASPPKTEYVLWNGNDHQLYETQNSPGARSFLPPYAIGSGNGVRSAPTVIIRADGERDVFWKGADGGLWVMSFTGFWSNAAELPEAGKIGSAPTAALGTDGIARVFFKSSDSEGLLWELSDVGGVWSTSAPLGTGTVGSAPAVVTRGGGVMDVFWLGMDRRLWRVHYVGSADVVAHPVPGAGKLGSAPAALLDANGVEDVFWRGTKGTLRELSDPFNPHRVSGPLNSGQLGSAPSVVIHSNAVQDVFWRGTHGGLREKVFADGWRDAFQVGGARHVDSRPAVAVSPDNAPPTAKVQTAEPWLTHSQRSTIPRSQRGVRGT